MDLLSVNFRQPRQRFQKDDGQRLEDDGIHGGTFSLSSAVTKKKENYANRINRSRPRLNLHSDQEDDTTTPQYSQDKMVNIYL